MTDFRTNSQEKNAPKATIGNSLNTLDKRQETPGPSNYVNVKKSIGDDSSHKVPFAM